MLFKDILNMDPGFLGEYSVRLQDSLEDILESVIYADGNHGKLPKIRIQLYLTIFLLVPKLVLLLSVHSYSSRLTRIIKL
jgi:hypothetical protein